ncbi:ABC transporter permease [Spirosoma gilvum]
MLFNYLKIALRNLSKNRVYTLLNIGGLTTGLACFAFIALWISDEWSYDRFNEKADRIYRISGRIINETETFEHAVSSVPMGPNLKNDYPEVENYVRFDQSDAIVKNGTQQFLEKDILATDPSFFDVFSYSLTQGNPKTALRDPYSLVLTESMAKKYFGAENPLGKSLTILLYDSTGRGLPFRITGVMPDAPKNAHFNFNFLTSFESLIAFDRRQFMSSDAWGDNSYYTYLLLKPGVDYKSLEAKLPQFYEKHIAPIMRKYGDNSSRTEFTLQPLTDIYLTSHRRYEINPTSSLNNLYIFGTVGLFILLLAGINYMNLATARSVQRAKETGVKKVIGALKGQLISQYLVEALVLALVSFVLAIGLCQLAQPLFELITDKAVSVSDSPILVGFMLGVALLLGLLSGLYPAFVISSYSPITVLKGSFTTSTKGTWLRQSLVILQFTITVILLVGILVINAQMSFIQHKNLGFTKDALLTLMVTDRDVQTNVEAFKNDVLASNLVKGLTTSNSILVGGLGNNGVSTVDRQGKKVSTSMYRLLVDYDYLNVMNIALAAGRNFSREFPADARTDSTQNYLLNEAAIKSFGWRNPAEAIGKPFAMNGKRGVVVGVVRDFHFNSLQHKVEPVALLLRGENFARMVLKIDMQHPKESIAWIEKQWKSHFPTAYLDFSFLDEKLGEQYQAETRFAAIFFYFSLLSVLIACLGLYGLTAFATQQRTKEIGVRKVLGASVSSIVTLLSKDFLKLVLISTLVAAPIAWYVMDRWLQDFAYRIDVAWWMFVVAGLLAFGIALLTVSFQSIKAALMNPVKSLKTE